MNAVPTPKTEVPREAVVRTHEIDVFKSLYAHKFLVRRQIHGAAFPLILLALERAHPCNPLDAQTIERANEARATVGSMAREMTLSPEVYLETLNTKKDWAPDSAAWNARGWAVALLAKDGPAPTADFAMKPVVSSNIQAIGYDEARKTLRIQFKDGGGNPGSLYEYPGVPKETHSALMTAPSIGSFFASTIKKAYPATKLG